jgi:hypothetical protein
MNRRKPARGFNWCAAMEAGALNDTYTYQIFGNLANKCAQKKIRRITGRFRRQIEQGGQMKAMRRIVRASGKLPKPLTTKGKLNGAALEWRMPAVFAAIGAERAGGAIFCRGRKSPSLNCHMNVNKFNEEFLAFGRPKVLHTASVIAPVRGRFRCGRQP